MAAPTAAFATYNQVGIREDLEDVIYDISPMDCYCFNHIARMRATNRLHDWQTNALACRRTTPSSKVTTSRRR